MTFIPYSQIAAFATPRIAAFSPGQSPPAVKIPMHCVTLPIDAGKATGTCRADQAVGQSCANADCLAMYTCDPTAHVCLGPQPNGSTCDNDRQCVSNNCAYPTCVAACP